MEYPEQGRAERERNYIKYYLQLVELGRSLGSEVVLSLLEMDRISGSSPIGSLKLDTKYGITRKRKR